ncbi:hypothetical protein [Nocardiopsis chromatogenes]|uniref:hypothetical protein n=1 Tax=Nocardiopsis chromatogenes TaxID=280239 RepID=UPI00034793FE|nr:hypothetical protein [Nocardiopsis chromatogenes]
MRSSETSRTAPGGGGFPCGRGFGGERRRSRHAGAAGGNAVGPELARLAPGERPEVSAAESRRPAARTFTTDVAGLSCCAG